MLGKMGFAKGMGAGIMSRRYGQRCRRNCLLHKQKSFKKQASKAVKAVGDLYGQRSLYDEVNENKKMPLKTRI